MHEKHDDSLSVSCPYIAEPWCRTFERRATDLGYLVREFQGDNTENFSEYLSGEQNIQRFLTFCGICLKYISPGRMGNNKQALQLIIQEENDVEKVSLVK